MTDTKDDKPVVLEQLFGPDDQEDGDPFAQLSQETPELAAPVETSEDVDEEKVQPPPPEDHPVPIPIDSVNPPKAEEVQLDEDASATQLAQRLSQNPEQNEDVEEPAIIEEDYSPAEEKADESPVTAQLEATPIADLVPDEEDAFSELLAGAAEVQPPSQPAPEPVATKIVDDKDFSDLLAEFEARDEGADIASYDTLAAVNEGHDAPASDIAALVGDSSDPSPFDDLIAEQDESTPILHNKALPDQSPVPALSIENSRLEGQRSAHDAGDTSVQSLFSNASDWLEDTSMEESFDLSGANGQTEVVDQKAEEFPEQEVPQGWYDDQGNWQWYTEEEREQVRTSMFGQSAATQSREAAVPVSENAARRTPQPAAEPVFSANAYDPYAPQSATNNSSYSASSSMYSPGISSQAAYSAAPSPYAPSSAHSAPSPYAPVAAGYGAYSAAPDPYAKAYPTGLGVASPPSAGPSKAAATKRPEPPSRVASNAYDPPFLRPQKSFVRPASAAPLVSGFVPPVPQLPAQLPQEPAPPAPPPAGPPRRSKTPSAPAFAAPPIQAPPMPVYTPPVNPSYQDYTPSQRAPEPEPVKQMPPPGPPKTLPRAKTYNAFDPPLRPKSAAKTRPPSVPPVSQFTPPTLSISPAPEVFQPPPRAASRSSRKASPMSDARPEVSPRPPSRGSWSSPRESQPEHRPNESYRASEPIQQSRARQDSWNAPTDAEEYDPEGGETEQYPSSSDYGKSDHYEPSYGVKPVEVEERDPEGGDEPYSHSTNFDGENREASSERETYPTQHSGAQDYSPYMPVDTANRGQSEHYGQDQPSYGLGLRHVSPDNNVVNPYAPQPQVHRQMSYSDNIHSAYGQSPYAPGPQATTSNAYAPEPSAYQPSPYDPSARSLLAPPDLHPGAAMSSYGSEFGTSPQEPSYFQAMTSDSTYTPQQVLEQRPVSEDPLGRCTLAARNAPLAVFGFGGVLITAFPALAEQEHSLGHSRTPSYGYASGRGQLWIRTVSDLASTSALVSNENTFPGPLILDPATSKGAIVEKKKREAVMQYLTARAEEIEKGLPYLKSSANRARREEEGKLVLVRLLSAMLIGDGKLSGSPAVEEAVRTALNGPSELTTGINLGVQPIGSGPSKSLQATPSQLGELSKFLVNGQKRDAANFAISNKLWAHALVISSSVDPELWAETVAKFAKEEIGTVGSAAGLKASYSLFSGRAATSVDDLVDAANVDGEAADDQWKEVISAVVFNAKPGDVACLSELGARLQVSGLHYAAHVCHILSPSSPFLDITPTSFDKPITLVQNPRDEDAIVFAEIAEYARSLIPIPKGQELPFPILPLLLPYKLQRAWLAAELGDVDLAKKYCAAIEAVSKVGKNGPSVLPPALSASLEDLNERLTGTPSINPAKLLSGNRKAKPGLDKIGSWLEGRLTKFIAGEEDGPAKAKPIPAASKDASASGGIVGPFSHFSTISPAASGSLSRQPSVADFSNHGQLGASPNSLGHSPLMQTSWGGGGREDLSSPYGGEQPSLVQDGETGDDEVGELLNPMAAMTFGRPTNSGSSDYQPSKQDKIEEDDDDLGFGNSSLSRGRTPRPAVEPSGDKGDKAPEKAAPAVTESKPEANKADQKGSWIGRWWGKKEGEGSGPIRAKLGEESSMVFDKEAGRWVVKGAKGETSAPATPPPPPKTSSPAPAPRPATNAPPGPTPQQIGRNGPPPGSGFTEMPNGGIKRTKSSAPESGPPSMSTPPGAPPGGPPGGGPPSRPPSRPATGTSIDDLLSRPPSKRPASAAKKPARNKYVDVFQPGA